MVPDIAQNVREMVIWEQAILYHVHVVMVLIQKPVFIVMQMETVMHMPENVIFQIVWDNMYMRVQYAAAVQNQLPVEAAPEAVSVMNAEAAV